MRISRFQSATQAAHDLGWRMSIFAGAGSSAGAKSLWAKLIMPPIKKQQIDFQKFRSNNSTARWFSSNRTAKLSSRGSSLSLVGDIERSRKWLAWSYDHVPGFAAVSETAYNFIARHRKFASAITRLLWGKDVRPPTYFWARRWFLRALGLIYLIAFVSLWVQVDGLVGSNGMSPVNQFLPAVRGQLGPGAYWLLPTLCWFNSSNAFLHFLCGGGVVLSLLLIFGIAPAISLVALFVFYLSLTIAGQVFLSFQWDILLLETGFLSIFFAPWQLWPGIRSAGIAIPATAPVSQAGLFLLKLLLFKLMLMSGVVKLTSGDDCWWNLTALDYHYWSQPLPTVFGWWADKSPGMVQTFLGRILPRRGNHRAVFHLGAAASEIDCCWTADFSSTRDRDHRQLLLFQSAHDRACLLLIDDSVSVGPDSRAVRDQSVGAPGGRALSQRLCDLYGAIVVIIVTLPINAWLIFTAFKPLSRHRARWRLFTKGSKPFAS